MKQPKLACRYAARYKASRAPTCGCLSCEITWLRKDLDTVRALLYALQHRLREESLAAVFGLLLFVG